MILVKHFRETTFLIFIFSLGYMKAQAKGSLHQFLPANSSSGRDTVLSESATSFPVTFGFDLVSRYIWRGMDFGVAPAFQPGVSYSVATKRIVKGDQPVATFQIGAWASYAVTGSFAETDLYATLRFPYVWIGLIDYYFPTETTAKDRYFNYGRNTAHIYEALIGFDGPENVPLSVFLGYNFHGPDDQPVMTITPADSINQLPADTTVSYVGWKHSFYVEGSYSFQLKGDVELTLILGGAYGKYYTQNSGYVRNGLDVTVNQRFNIVNAGVRVAKTFELGEKHKVQLPVSVSLITNPDARKFYFVAGIGIWNQ
ncbi:MAG: hypothetical protein KatS3mg031_1150 [Chitinophagales bacterium]|nr:MAG: hypothetical protein KatS3mg031_1150 [Chitinophagales bacterium]